MAYNTNKPTNLAALEALAQKLKTNLTGKADKATTLAGYGIEDAYTKEQLDSRISVVYKAGGSFAFAELPTADEAHLGMVYNVTDAFNTTDSFVEGAGNKHPAGTNVVVVAVTAGEGESVTASYKYDVLAGFVDLSEYAKTADVLVKEEGKGLSTNDFTNDAKTKLDGVAEGATKVEASETVGYIKINGTETKVFDTATDEEVTEMLNTMFGDSEG